MNAKNFRIVFCLIAGALSLYLFAGFTLAANVDEKTQPKLSNDSSPAVKVPTQPRQLNNYDPIWETHEIAPSPRMANVEAPTRNVRPKLNIKLPPRHVQPKVNIQTPTQNIRPATNVKLPTRPHFKPQDPVQPLQQRPLYQPQVHLKLKTQTSTLNSEFNKELLSPEYPTDSRGSGFREFFRPRGNLQAPTSNPQPELDSRYITGKDSQQSSPANRITTDECGKLSRSRILSKDRKKCVQ